METRIIAEQREQRKPADLSIAAPPPQPLRGRPFAKGRSGNPAGRPPRRAMTAGYLANALIAEKSVELTHKLLRLALNGDRTALRMCMDRIAPAPRQAPATPDLPPLVSDLELNDAMAAVVEAAGRGALRVTHAMTLARALTVLLQPGGTVTSLQQPDE